MKDVVIIGGGVAGLSCAHYLRREGISVRVIEVAEKAGGNLRSEKLDGYTLEQGPHSFMASSDAIWELIELLGLENRLLPARAAGNSRYIYREGNLNRLPTSPGSFLSSGFVSFPGKLRLMMEPFMPNRASEKESAREFFIRRLGKEAADWVIAPFISGVYAGDPERLSAPDAFAKMWSWEKESGSMISGARKYMKKKRKERGERAKLRGLFSFDEGLGVLTERLAMDLGNSLNLSETVKKIISDKVGWQVNTDVAAYRARHLVLATPPHRASMLVKPVFPQMGALFDQIEMAPVAVAHLAVNGEDAAAIPDGFGFLVPRNQQVRLLGCIFMSKLYPVRAPEGHELLTVYIGGSFDPQAVNENDETLIEDTLQDLERILGRRMKPVFHKVLKHPHAIPQFTHGHRERVRRIQELGEQIGHLSVIGNYVEGVGMDDAARSGRECARAIAEVIEGR